MTDWIMFSGGLPADASVTEVEIYYDAVDPSSDILRAGTYGRGLWESDVYHTSPWLISRLMKLLFPLAVLLILQTILRGTDKLELGIRWSHPSTSTERILQASCTKQPELPGKAYRGK